MYTFSNIEQLQLDLQLGQVNCQQLVEDTLVQIQNQKHLNAYLETFEATAKQKAAAVDQKIKLKTQGKLAGVIIGIKDNICYKNHKLSCASKILDGFESLYSSTVVEKLLAEDAIIIGRLNCDEFAMGSSNEKSAFGKVLNPINIATTPGGSSGGCSAAVAANLCHVSIGSDTGGSVRQPAAFTGTVGLKPTYGRVSRWGLAAYASSFDQIGPITKTVKDSALMLSIISGADSFDATVSRQPVPNYVNALNSNKKYKICYIKECVENASISAEVKQNTLNTIEKFKALGHTVESITFPYLDYLVPIYYILTTAEASSNLSRYDGVHFGYRSPNATDIESIYKKSRSEGFGIEVKRRIMLGTFVLSAGFYDTYYKKAQRVRQLIQNETNELFKQYDFIITPSTPRTAFKFGANDLDPIQMYLEDIYTVQANIVGCPAISVPNGTDSKGNTIGFQIMARNFEEEQMFNLANQI